MRISAVVGVSNRKLPSLNLSNGRPQRSYLSIGYFSGKNKEYYILHQNLYNKPGVKYKVRGNIENIFSRFLDEGRGSIRFINPPHDLIIKSNAKQMRSFFKLVQLILENKIDWKCVHLSNLAAPSKVPASPKTKLVITSKAEYPTLDGFPRTLEVLQINKCELSSINCRILRLQNLRVLNLEENKLKGVPEQIELLPCLRELYLSSNYLGTSTDWRWLKSNNICTMLTLLDLRNNKLTHLPRDVVRLGTLRSLLIDNNDLTCLPLGIGRLRNLRVLQMSNNKVSWLPGSMRLLKLDMFDFSHNGDGPNESLLCEPPLFPPMSLLHLAARATLLSKLEVREGLVPLRLVELTEDCSYCVCGEPTFPAVPHAFLPFRLKRISASAVFSTFSPPQIAVRFCSSACTPNVF